MKKKKIFFLSSLVLVLFLSDCTADYFDYEMGKTSWDESINGQAPLAALLEREGLPASEFTSQFADGLIRSLDTDSTVVISPYLLQMSLVWLAERADSDVREELMAAMGLNGADLSACRQFFVLSSAFLENRLTGGLSFARSVWAQKGVPLQISTSASPSGKFDPHISYVDFEQRDETRQYMWEWMERIRPHAWDPQFLFDDIFPHDLRMAMLDVALFCDSLLLPFTNRTEQPFTCADGTVRTLSMASGVFGTLAYAENEQVQGVMFPHSNGLTSLCVYLPREGCPLSDAMKNVPPFTEKEKATVRLTMPTFDFCSFVNWEGPLRRMGVNRLWEEEGALDKLNPQLLPISIGGQTQLKMQPSLMKKETDETSATADLSLVFNRPYFFRLVENSTGLVLMEGQVAKL